MTSERVAGYNERRCISRDTLGLYGWVAVTGKYTLNQISNKSPWQGQLFSAVKHCLSRHAALSAVVQTALKPPKITQVPQVDLRKHIQILTSQPATAGDGLDTLLAEVHRHKLVHDGTIPQWHLFVLPVVDSGSRIAFQLSFACSHVLMDGMSGSIFHAALLEGLNSVSTPAEQDPVWHRSAMLGNLPPALDQVVKLPISWSFLLKPLLGEFLPGRLTKLFGIDQELGIWHGTDERPAPPVDRQLVQTAIHIASFSSLELDQTLQLCRRHKCKLTSLINLVFARCLSEALKERQQEYTRFKVEVPYDLRRSIPGMNGCIANYASAVDIILDTSILAGQDDTDDLWEAVRRDTELLQRSASSLNDQPVALLKYLSDFDDWVTRRASKPSEASFSTSNIGNFTPGNTSEGEWNVKEMAFSQSADATGAPINVNIASIQGGRLWIVLTWLPGMLGVDDEHSLIKTVCERLDTRVKRLIV